MSKSGGEVHQSVEVAEAEKNAKSLYQLLPFVFKTRVYESLTFADLLVLRMAVPEDREMISGWLGNYRLWSLVMTNKDSLELFVEFTQICGAPGLIQEEKTIEFLFLRHLSIPQFRVGYVRQHFDFLNGFLSGQILSLPSHSHRITQEIENKLGAYAETK